MNYIDLTNSAALVMENAKKGTFVSWLRIPKNKDLTVTISPGDSFELKSDVIVTTRAFDREKRDSYDLLVTVCETTRAHR